MVVFLERERVSISVGKKKEGSIRKEGKRVVNTSY